MGTATLDTLRDRNQKKKMVNDVVGECYDMQTVLDNTRTSGRIIPDQSFLPCLFTW